VFSALFFHQGARGLRRMLGQYVQPHDEQAYLAVHSDISVEPHAKEDCGRPDA